ncbi:ead/Ea22-like family protein [Escherichia coli]|uniref:ead/Ea22-like family protein n=1 Tax=Escherichia coli TaxID=562 RepID=UPI000A338330|nr:ead/Ea22-like family protein [Escherichia coli]EFA7747687.1 ead/Ea22-like family protein [Escherichia coli]EFL3028870.1 ead/Ea22-like family protein [Escherichia coli]EFL3074138.1 ead/Ea22-like family protein [Escherichia coli]EFM9253146.1 ead/Ea22-like family protein [Escherichia coli]EGH4589901.1 ead/Ea22-like family protein [Escherichia coli]
MSKINYQELREAAERAIPEMELLTLPFDAWLSKQELKDYGVDIDVINTFRLLAGPETMLELLDEIKRQEDTNIDATCRISELETILATLVAENAGLRHVMTTSIEHENVEIEQTAGCPRFKLKGKDRLIADLRKQRAEWIRKALRYSEERAALAKRIEEMEQANTRQDANINHQQEGVTQSVTRYIYHYNAVNGSDSMSGIARLSFMIKSQSDLEELKSALRNIGGFRAKAITSLSYLGREEEGQNDEKP